MRSLLAAAVLLALCAPAAAGALREPDLLVRRAFGPATDRERFVTYTLGPRQRDRLQVLDTRTGERRSLPKDPRCRPPAVLTAAGRAILNCRRGGPAEQSDLLDLRTGAVTPLPRFVPNGEAQEPAVWGSIGRHWAEGVGMQTGRNLAVNWRTGELRVFPAGIGPAYDLDDPALPEYAACHHWERRGDVSSYEHPYFLTSQSTPTFGLLHCNGGRRALWRGSVDWTAIAGGRVTWVARKRLFAYDTHTRRRSAWRLPPTRELAEEPLQVFRTRRAAIIATTRSETCPKGCDPWTSELYVAWLRRP